MLKLFQLWLVEVLSISMSFWHTSVTADLVVFAGSGHTSLHSNTTKMIQDHFVYFLYHSKNQTYIQGYLVPFLETGTRNQDLSTRIIRNYALIEKSLFQKQIYYFVCLLWYHLKINWTGGAVWNLRKNLNHLFQWYDNTQKNLYKYFSCRRALKHWKTISGQKECFWSIVSFYHLTVFLN